MITSNSRVGVTKWVDFMIHNFEMERLQQNLNHIEKQITALRNSQIAN